LKKKTANDFNFIVNRSGYVPALTPSTAAYEIPPTQAEIDKFNEDYARDHPELHQ